MSQLVTSAVAFAVGLLGVVDSVQAQRGGRGRSEEIKGRVGCYFVDVPMPDGDKPADALNSVAMVQDAAKGHQSTMLYVCDTSVDAPKLETFQQTVFSNDELGVSLRCFHCGKIDIAGSPAAKASLGKQVPLFIVFGPDGKRTGEVSMTGFRAQVNPLVQLLGKTAAGTVQPSLAEFVTKYRAVINDLEQIEGKRKVLQDKLTRLNDKGGNAPPQADAKRADIEKDTKELDAQEQKVKATEKELLEKAKIPVRPESAKRLGDKQRGG